LAGLIPVLALSVAGWQRTTGFNAATTLVSGPDANTGVGDVLLRGMLLVKSATGTDAALVGDFLDQGATPDLLTRVQVQPNSGTASAAPAPAPITVYPNLALPPGQLVSVGGVNVGIRIPGIGPSNPPQLGTFVTATFTFRDAGVVRVRLLIRPPTGFLADHAS
jgi:hypothetical protein